MWRTPQGDRALQGAEATLFRYGVLGLAQKRTRSGFCAYFTRLTPNEQLHALAIVAQDLLDPDRPFAGHAAWKEAAIYAVYRYVAWKAEGVATARRLIHKACAETGYFDDADELPELRTADDYRDAAEALADLVLWDRDWELEDEIGGVADCDEDYFVMPPAPTPQRVDAARDFLTALSAAAEQ